MEDNRIIVHLNRHMVILYPNEIGKLLSSDEELYIKAIKRGKGELRCQSSENRKDAWGKGRR